MAKPGPNPRNPGDEFGRVAGALLLTDGTLVVLDSFDRSVTWIDGRGRSFARAGQEGDGPGEFRRPHWIGSCDGSTVLVADYRTNRLSAFDGTGVFLHSFRFPGGHPSSLSCAGSARLAASIPDPAPPGVPIGPYRLGESVQILDMQGRDVAVVGRIPGSDRYRSQWSDMPRDLMREIALAAGHDRLYVGWADDHWFRILTLEGHPLARVSWDGPALDLTPGEWAVHTANVIRDVPARYQEQREILRRFYATSEPVRRLPAYRRFIVESGGRLWVEAYPRPGQGGPRRWQVFDAGVEWVGEVTVPAGLTVLHVDPDRLVASSTDAGERPVVGIYLIESGSSGEERARCPLVSSLLEIRLSHENSRGTRDCKRILRSRNRRRAGVVAAVGATRVDSAYWWVMSR